MPVALPRVATTDERSISQSRVIRSYCASPATSCLSLEIRAIVVVIVIVVIVINHRDLSQLLPHFTLRHKNKTTTPHAWHGICIEALLRHLSVAGVTHAHAHTPCILPMGVSTTEKAGAVWWHLVQEQRSRAFEQLTLRKWAQIPRVQQTDVMITVTWTRLGQLDGRCTLQGVTAGSEK